MIWPRCCSLRGVVFSHEAVRDWEAKLAPVLASALRQRQRQRQRRHGKGGMCGRHWHVDEIKLRVCGRWCYLYRATDRAGNLVDTLLSEHRDMAAAQASSRSARAATGITPERVATDGHGSYPRAIRTMLGRGVEHRTSAYKNNGLEQDHRGIKGRVRCMRGFNSLHSADRFCRAYDELPRRDQQPLPPPLRPRHRH